MCQVYLSVLFLDNSSSLACVTTLDAEKLFLQILYKTESICLYRFDICIIYNLIFISPSSVYIGGGAAGAVVPGAPVVGGAPVVAPAVGDGAPVVTFFVGVGPPVGPPVGAGGAAAGVK